MTYPNFISGYFFYDSDADNTEYDANGNWEDGPVGVEIQLIDSSGNVVATTTTGHEGYYCFNDIPPGNYQNPF